MVNDAASRVGFLGLGVMGQPMALRLARAGVDLVVWNRTASRCRPLADAGAEVATSAAEVCASTGTIIVMLSDGAAIDQVLDRCGSAFAGLVRERVIIVMGTHEPAYSMSLEADVLAAGGAYVEAPVSGSRQPAETGDLVAMLAGADAVVVEQTRALIAPLVRHSVGCGAVPSALTTKLAVNSFMITMLTGLAEAVHLADRHGVDRRVLAEVLLGGTLASPLLATKLAKLVAGDHDAQAAITDVAKNTALITAAAADTGAAAPLARVCDGLFGEAVDLGFGGADLIAVIEALEARADNL
ncbi:MAG: NAD(P)-dependent oxidoreductase [Propionibacteriaceae bacterium]